MAYSWDNRVKFVVRYMYDIDNNGFLDKNDFECLAVRNTVIETKGEWNDAQFKTNQKVMEDLWNQIAELADFNKVVVVLVSPDLQFSLKIFLLGRRGNCGRVQEGHRGILQGKVIRRSPAGIPAITFMSNKGSILFTYDAYPYP